MSTPDPHDTPPPLRDGNPGCGVEGRFSPPRGKKGQPEEVNVVDLLERLFREKEIPAHRHPTSLALPDSGFLLLPRIVAVNRMQPTGLHTITTIQVHHPTLVPDGVFEFQHSWGDSAEEALFNGFDQWFRGDFVTLLDALAPRPTTCMIMEMSFPEKDGRPPFWRRAVLGPVAHFQDNPPPADSGAEEHPFCPCCFFTNTFPAFKHLIEDPGFYALRLFGARSEDGTPQADCRINGEDWDPGMDALREYVQTWPGTGYEFRKQYVLLQTIDKPIAAPTETE